MAFNTKEQEIIKYGLENGKSKEEVQKALTNYRLGITPPKVQPKIEGYSLGELGQDIKQTGQEIYKSAEEAQTQVGKAKGAFIRGEQGALETAGQVVGTSAGLMSNAIGSIFKGIVKSVLPQNTETAIKGGIEKAITPIAETELVKGIIQKYNSLDERTKRNIDAAIGAGSFALDVATMGGGKKAIDVGVKEGLNLGTKALKTGAESVEGVAKTIAPVIETTGKVATGIKNVAETTGESIKRIPGRIATNVAENKATTEAIKKLPTQIAKDAVVNGIDINDVKYLYKLSAGEKKPLQQLFKTTKDFVSGASKTNPIEVVGKPVVERIKTFKKSVSTIGQKLGKVADNLGTVTTEEALPKIFESLKKVPGLSGLKISKKGVLNFSDTVLQSVETAGDRKAIQRIFTDAIKAGTGKQKHLLRQELFEVLGGKKGAMVAMTATQDKAYQAIRKGLSELLDIKNSAYKALNAEYAKAIEPLNKISKFMKLNKLIGAGEDILNMDAGLLVRRLTSNAMSNPELKNIFRALGIEKETLNLQDFYNFLDKYYNIAGKTTLQGQVQRGVEKVSGLQDILTQTAEKVAGKSEAVRKKALEDVINEVLR